MDLRPCVRPRLIRHESALQGQHQRRSSIAGPALSRHPRPPRHTPLRAHPRQCESDVAGRQEHSHPNRQRSRSRPLHLLHHRGTRGDEFRKKAADAGDMASRGRADYRARRREREQQRRKRDQRIEADNVSLRQSEPTDGPASDPVRRAAATSCAWCGGVITPRSRGPIPKWCSPTCRHRAWEQTRAAASGRSAVQIVQRRVEVPTAVPLTRRDWPRVLRDLTTQLNDGRVYDRDLPALTAELRSLLEAYQRRQHVRNAPGLS